jgi:hypothetical protein
MSAENDPVGYVIFIIFMGLKMEKEQEPKPDQSEE